MSEKSIILFPDVNELPVKQIKRCTITPWCEQQQNMINDSWVKEKVCWTVGCKQMLRGRRKMFVISLRTSLWKITRRVNAECLSLHSGTHRRYFVYLNTRIKVNILIESCWRWAMLLLLLFHWEVTLKSNREFLCIQIAIKLSKICN